MMLIGGVAMDEWSGKALFYKSPIAYSWHKIILDEQGDPCDYELLEGNGAYERLTGLRAADFVGKRFKDVLSLQFCAGSDRWEEACRSAAENCQVASVDMKQDMTGKWLRVTAVPLGQDTVACTWVDVTKEYWQEQVVAGLLEICPDTLCVVDAEWRLCLASQGFADALGYAVDELVGKEFFALVDGTDEVLSPAGMKALNKQKNMLMCSGSCCCKDGSHKRFEWRVRSAGSFIYVCAAGGHDEPESDDSSLNETMEKKNEHIAISPVTDELTGLYNGRFFNKIIIGEMERADRYDETLSIAILDLDHFSEINDLHGRLVGDEVLQRTAELASCLVRKSDILIRMGGGEFVVLMPHTSTSGATVVAEKIRATLGKNAHPVAGCVTGSFGVAERMRSESFTSWYKRAGAALRRAKEEGQNRVISSGKQEGLPFASVQLVWKSQWESGHGAVDEQRRNLVELANNVMYLSLLGVGQEQVLEQLGVLIKHIDQQFHYEEQVLAESGYPDYARHVKIHQYLSAKAAKLYEAYQSGTIKLPALFSFVTDEIIVGHIINEDACFFPYVQKKCKS